MAGSPVAAASPSVPGPHQETESEQETESDQGTDYEEGTDSEQEQETRSGPEPEATTGADATKSDSDGEDGSNQDAASVRTTTTDLFPENKSHGPEPEARSKQHKLGLDINEPWGWDGSSYNDFDVVTVHGIRDDYRTAWTDAEGNWWVKNQVFTGLDIREIDYSYEIDGESMLYGPEGIAHHARALITAYAAVRRDLEDTETDRPVIWICHDLGGTIVKEALSIAAGNPAKYGKIAVLTTAIIFLGTPHRFESAYDAEDQLCKLALLPGPDIGARTLSKVRELARQVTRINERFLATKVLDRAAIFNTFTHNERASKKQTPIGGKAVDTTAASPDGKDGEDVAADPVTPFPRYAHLVGHSFEAAGRFRLSDIDHLAIVRGEPGSESGNWFPWLSDLFNLEGLSLRVNYRALPFQAWLLSLAPPTRALDTPFDPVMPEHPAITWIHEQGPYTAFSKPGRGPRLLHLHANGNRLLDISSLSRVFYLDYDAFIAMGAPDKTMIYFEFDQHDSRYNTISSLLLYLLNALTWHFWEGPDQAMLTELKFLSQMHAWSLDDMFHLYSKFRRLAGATRRLTIFISCFDQCPSDQRQWFLERVLEEQSHSDDEYRIVVSTSARDDLVVTGFPDGARINLDDCPALTGPRDSLADELRSGLSALIAKRPIYEDFRPQLETLFERCGDVPYLGSIILTWLGIHHRGKPRSEIADKISKLSPPTAENVVRVFIASLAPPLRTRAETVFNWIKNAAEPWSPESMTEALAVRELDGGEPSFEDLDVQGTMNEIEETFGGIIALENGDIQFSHASFYHVPEVGFEESGSEATARANGTIAETCLRYFQLSCAQETLAELSLANMSSEGPWAAPLNSAVISHPRSSMADYAIRFWHQHYKRSGKFRPRELVDDLFSSREARAAWEMPFWLFSNPFTRMQRTYISTLPVFAMLGLEDLVEEKVRNESGRPTFEKDCWYAITEAARAGRKAMVQQLLEQVAVDEEELQVALHWGAGRGDAGIVNVLLGKIPNLETFRWADINLMHQAAAAGLDELLAAMLLSGHDVNQINELYFNAPPTLIATWRKRISTLDFLLSSEHKPNLSIKDTFAGETPLQAAINGGHPRIIEVLVQGGAEVDDAKTVQEEYYGAFTTLVQRAARARNHRAIDALIKAGADFKSGDGPFGPPLFIAATSGSDECVRVLLAHGADPNTEFEGEPVLHQAVGGNHTGVTRQLLTHDPKPDMDKTPPGQEKLLLRAVREENVELVSLLVDHGVEIDYHDDQANGFAKTPLAVACAKGCLDIAKFLLSKGADINYAGRDGTSDSPLLGALNDGAIEVAKYLLQNETIDVKRAATDGTTPLHLACDPGLISELLKRGAPIDGHSIHFGTTLHRAALRGEPEEIEALLANDPKPEVDYLYGKDAWDQTLVGSTPLHLACQSVSLESIKSLLKGGANPKLKRKDGEDAVDILIRMGSDSNDALECIRLLLSAPYSVPVDQVVENGQTRLHRIQETTPVSIVQLLVEANAPLDLEDKHGRTPLSVAVSQGNGSVAKYLVVKHGVNVNRRGPIFGSILHIAVKRGDLDMTKFLLDSGADRKAVHPEYGESLLYTALGIEDDAKMNDMVRYLVDEVKASINERGGAMFGYPIIRAANLARFSPARGARILKFLIRRKAQLDVADSQGRRAVHVACASGSDDAIRVLVEARAEIDVKDKMGRKPIHFAVSAMPDFCLRYLMDTFEATDINQTDDDKWTPLMWAARSGAFSSLVLDSNTDLSARVRGPDETGEWTALKLMKFHDRRSWELEELRVEYMKINETEEWDDSDFRNGEVGDNKIVACDSCFVRIRGKQYKCMNCDDGDGFSLCFKCYGHRSIAHNAEHDFDDIPPLYEDHGMSPEPSAGEDQSDDDDNSDAALQKTSGFEGTSDIQGSGNAAASSRAGSPNSEDSGSDNDSSDGED